MVKKILVFSNGEKIGDGIIKLQLLHEIKTRLPDYKLYWLTNKEKLFILALLNSLHVIILMKYLIKQILVLYFGKKYQKDIN